MQRNNKVLLLLTAVILVTGISFLAFYSEAAEETRHTLAILSTTDEHQYLVPYDYMNDEPDETIGLSKIYTLVREAREEYDNTLLFSAGDFIQGSLIGEMESTIDPLQGHDFQTIVKAFNIMGYDAVSVGNHDVTDFGLDFFERARDNSVFPWLSANIKLAAEPEKPYIKPYTVLRRHVDGIPIDVGVISFVPPQIMNWGRRHLEGEVITKEIIAQAERYLPELQEKSDIVIVVAHTGIDDSALDSDGARENAGYYLAQFDEVDALALGHQHDRFPGEYEGLAGVDNEKGLIHGKPAVLPGSWGESLGVIELELSYSRGEWEAIGGSSHLRDNDETVASHSRIEEIARSIHEKTVEYVRTPLGRTEKELASYFSRVKDSALIQLINDAQLWYGKQVLASTEYADLPVLSAAAPFIAGREGPHYFTHVNDEINIGDVTDVYIYPNTVYIMKLNGSQLKDYLEHAGRNFNRIESSSSEEVHLINYELRAFNYDVIEGIEYEFDLSEPVGRRVTEIKYQGNPVTEDMKFLVVMNNYRASGGGDYPHMSDENIVLATTDVNREQIISYIENQGVVNPEPTNNWRVLLPANPGRVVYRSAPKAVEYLGNRGIDGIKYQGTDDRGWGVYRVDPFFAQ